MNDETTATSETPEKIYICPACGMRYDVPTTCANGHPPVDAIEYDRATVVAADGGDADAIASVAATEAAAGGVGAGTIVAEATPADGLTVPPPVPAEVVPGTAGNVETPAPEPEPVAAPPSDTAALPESDVALLDKIETALTDVLTHTQAALDELATLRAEAGA